MSFNEPPFKYNPRTIDEVRACVNSFDFALIENSSIGELQDKIGEIILTYSTKYYSLNPGGVILRGRINDKQILYSEVSELWYPPSDLVTRIGRCNNVNQSVFYCSINPETILRELKPTKGSWITILECKTPNFPWSPLIPIGIQAIREINIELFNIFKNHFVNSFSIGEDGKQINLMLDKFLTELFQQRDENYYKITVAISNILLDDQNVNGIIYPSIASNLNGLNFVIRPQFADKNIFPYHAVVYEVADKSESSYYIKRLYNSEILSNQSTLRWNKVPTNNIPPAEYEI